jgi:hypothetical protein
MARERRVPDDDLLVLERRDPVADDFFGFARDHRLNYGSDLLERAAGRFGRSREVFTDCAAGRLVFRHSSIVSFGSFHGLNHSCGRMPGTRFPGRQHWGE